MGMYCLRIHSVDAPLQEDVGLTGISSGDGESAATSTSRNPKPNSIIQVLRGIVHLYRRPLSISSSSSPFGSSSSVPHSSDLLPAGRGTLLFVLAVPIHLSPEGFLRFCGSYADRLAGIQVIRNEGMEDRYSVLVNFDEQKIADAFYLNLNGWRFSSAEGDICHILFLASVECTDSTEIACTPPVGSTELPTCPVCIERLDQEITGIMSTTCDHSFRCSCISKWANSSCSVCQFCQEHSAKPICSLCETSENLWICVICGFVGCGRYKEGHAFRHWKDTQHCFSLDLETQRVWDYVGDNHVHRINQSKSDDEIFKMKSNCRSSEGHCESCADEDSGINGALLSSKVEAIVDEYNRLLASQLENQRMYYETLLEDAKQRRERCISEAVDGAVSLKIEEIQLEIEKVAKEKKIVAETNENLMKNQNHWREKIKEIEQRERETVRLKDQKIHELKEEIRDFTVFIEAQKALDIRGSADDDIRRGTLLPVPSPPASSPRSKRSSKSSRKRNY